MSLLKKHPSKTGIMQKTGKSGSRKNPSAKRRKSFYGMKDSQEMVTKVIHRLWVPKGATLSLACAIHARCMINFSQLFLIK
jgi:hypothetical protein